MYWGIEGILCPDAGSWKSLRCVRLQEAPAAVVVPLEMGCFPAGARGAASALLALGSSLGGWELCCGSVPSTGWPHQCLPWGRGAGELGAPCWGAVGLQAPALAKPQQRPHSSTWGWGPATPIWLCCPTRARGSVLLPRQLFPQLSVSSVLLQLPSLVSQVYRSAFGLWVSDCHPFPNPTSQPAVGISIVLKFPK